MWGMIKEMYVELEMQEVMHGFVEAMFIFASRYSIYLHPNIKQFILLKKLGAHYFPKMKSQ